jgi:hypothetical protein
MSDSSSTSVSFPICVNSNDKRPLPEIIAHYCGFPLVSHPVEGRQYYSVQDWIAGVARVKNPRRFWSDMKRLAKEAGIELYERIVQLPYKASNGKHYIMDHVTDESLYRITQRMRAETGIRDQVLQFLAKAGVVIDEYRIDPERAIDAAIAAYKRMGKTDRWIEQRLRNKLGRNQFTAAFKQALRVNPHHMQYAIITDEMRQGLWKRTTKTLKVELGLKEKDNLRDHLSEIALSYETLAEQISARELNQRNDLEFNQARHIVRSDSEFVGKQAEDTGRKLGVDIATDRPLLPGQTENN